MNIWLMTIGEPLPLEADVRKHRTGMLADKLVERGHMVHRWTSAFEHQQKIMVSKKDRNFNVSKRYTIRALRGCQYRKNVSISRYIDHQIVALKFRIRSGRLRKKDVNISH